MGVYLNKARLFLNLALVSIFLSSLQIVWIPFVSYGETIRENITSYTISGCLWGFLITGYILLYKAQHYCRLAQQKSGIHRLRRYKLNVGIFNIFTSAEAFVFDIIAFISLLATVISSIFWQHIRFAIPVSAAIFVFTFQMHCILNGRIYINIKSLEARRTKR